MSSEVLIKNGDKANWGTDSAPIDPKRLPEGYPYEDVGLIDVVKDVTVSVVTPLGENAFYLNYFAPLDELNNISPDLDIYVIYDGSTYEHVPVTVEQKWNPSEQEYMDIFIVGNLTEYPFCIYSYQLRTTTSGSHTICVKKKDIIINKLSAKYLPASTPTTAGAIKQAAAVANVTAAPTAEEFNALLKSLRDAGILATE